MVELYRAMGEKYIYIWHQYQQICNYYIKVSNPVKYINRLLGYLKGYFFLTFTHIFFLFCALTLALLSSSLSATLAILLDLWDPLNLNR